MQRVITGVLLCITAVSSTHSASHNTVVSSPQNKKKKQPSYRQLQEQLGSEIRTAFTVTQSALEGCAHALCDSQAEWSYQQIRDNIQAITRDQKILQAYIEQIMTGDPAVSRAQMHDRIKDVEHIQKRWNIF